jgi:hypothetical protein
MCSSDYFYCPSGFSKKVNAKSIMCEGEYSSSCTEGACCDKDTGSGASSIKGSLTAATAAVLGGLGAAAVLA